MQRRRHGDPSAHTCRRAPLLSRRAEGEWVKKEGTKFSSLRHNPRERQDLDITANWQWALRSRLDLPLPLKFIFQPLCFGKFHQVLDRAVIREAGYDCSCTKGLHLKNEMTHSQTAAKWPIIFLSVARSDIFGENNTFAKCAFTLGCRRSRLEWVDCDCFHTFVWFWWPLSLHVCSGGITWFSQGTWRCCWLKFRPLLKTKLLHWLDCYRLLQAKLLELQTESCCHNLFVWTSCFISLS